MTRHRACREPVIVPIESDALFRRLLDRALLGTWITRGEVK